ncbi:hypothetical protein CYD26_10455 [Pseudomonas sp. FFUP_PS_473]|jgi:hypothetical protein|uniref:hypothetical protein n=1 Tax=Pseudomonas sp. FFUP_PS_473 TaxID=2060418 RepID=UPI000C79BB11|nr:hypothetical protein [Pseudomonas sp. FFUP_PS_473]PLP92490.1 hypothetical protein CYD26_10455 [Pseudomonas sp. FFUP_PS_473]
MKVDKRQARLIDALARLGFVIGGLGFVSVLAIITGFDVFNRLWLALLVVILIFTTGCWLVGLACARASSTPADTSPKAPERAVPVRRRRPHELILLTLIMLLFVGGYTATAYLAARAGAAIVATCVTQLTSTLVANEQEQALAYLVGPVCQCISQRFMEKNGVVRLALLHSQWFNIATYSAVTDAEQMACMERFLSRAPPPTHSLPPNRTKD